MADLADRLNRRGVRISVRTLWYYEGCQYVPRLDVARAIMRVLS